MLMEAAKGGHFDTMSLLLDWPTTTSTSSTSHTAVTSTDTGNKVDNPYPNVDRYQYS